MKTSKPYIIGISSVSGGDKTTLTIELKNKLPNSDAIFFKIVLNIIKIVRLNNFKKKDREVKM